MLSRIFLPLLILLNVTVALASSPPAPNRPIVEPDPMLSSVVSIQLDFRIPGFDRKGKCTGTLLTPDIVVTAAHCAVKYLAITPRVQLTTDAADPSDLQITFGNWNESVSLPIELRRAVTGVIVHPQFNNQDTPEKRLQPVNDIAILKLDRSAPRGYQPATVLASDDRLVDNTPITAAGFGANMENFHLSALDTVILNAQYKSVGAVGIYTGNSDRNEGVVYSGYSGGPAFVEVGGLKILWGVCNGGWKGMNMYQNIPFYLPWIQDSIRMLSGDLRMSFAK